MTSSTLSRTGKNLKALVTAGSTIGQIDAVRYLEQIGADTGNAPDIWRLERFEMQNPFKGALGLRIAEALHRSGVAVTLLTREDLLPGFRHTLPQSCISAFRTFDDLESSLPSLITGIKPDLVWQAAAVSDWVPVEVEGIAQEACAGKIDSAADTLKIVFRKTPKLLDRIRPLAGPGATIVGFKLLVNVTEAQMSSRAREQISRAAIDFCVGNDNTRITKTEHPVALFDRTQTVRNFSGTKEETAGWLVETILTEHLQKVS